LFAGAPLSEDFGRFHRRGLAAYGHKCAFTGMSPEPTPGLFSGLDLVPIRPLDEGGLAEMGNYLAAIPEMGAAFAAGHLGVGERDTILADLSGVGDTLLRQVNSSGKIHLPADPSLRPKPENLAFHRAYTFNRSQGRSER
jgi:predicted restriction endonuclease